MTETKAKQIQQDQFQDLMNTYGSYIYNFALKLTAQPEDANDVLQTTFLKAWQHIDTLKNPASTKYWLRTICFNEFKMWLRKNKQFTVDFKENMDIYEQDDHEYTIKPSIIDEIAMEEEVKKLRDGCFLAMTRKLTLPQRIAFSLVDMFGLSIAETATLCNITPKAVNGLLYRARACLTSFFKHHCSILDMSNPCSCKAWIKFMEDRDKFQQTMKTKPSILIYQKRDFDSEIYQKILSIYQQMPDQRPNENWYTNIIQIIHNN